MNAGSVIIVQVPCGQVIEGPNGERFTVDEQTAVFRGRRCYVTPDKFQRIKAEIDRANAEELGI